MTFLRSARLSNHPLYRALRACSRGLLNVHLPIPGKWFRPLRWLVLLMREGWYFLARVFWAEPLFKAACQSYGRNLRTGPKLHWVQGAGHLILGDNVVVDGCSSFFFASRYSDSPTLTIGNHSGIGHNCSFVVGRSITIGEHCRFGAFVTVMDSPGHPLDPDKRRTGAPANPEDVRPVTIGDNVWVGTWAVIFPGVTIGDNSVVATGAVVMSNVAPNVVVAGNPARQISAIRPPA